MQARGRANRPPIGIALDGDLGNRIDALLAVAMLNGFAAKGEARNIAVAISRTSLNTARMADVVVGFYSSRPATAAPAMIGMPDDGATIDDAPPITAMLHRKAADGTPVYESRIDGVLDTADNAVLIRNMLLAQHDGNARIVLAGPATGLARLLGLYGSLPQIAAKVDCLVMAVGAFPSGAADPSIAADPAAMQKVLAEWPTPIVAVGSEVGAALPFPGASIEKGMAYAAAHPVADAYRAFKPMPYDAPSSALAATLYAVHPDQGLFQLSEPGTIAVSADGRTTFTPEPAGRHRYLIVDAAQRDHVVRLQTELVTAPPAPRPSRGRGAPPAQQAPPQQQKPTPAAPAGTKPPAS